MNSPADSEPEATGKLAPGQFIVPLIIGSALFMEMLDSTVVATALPSMARSLHQDPIKLNLAITSYLLSLAVFIPISGWVADRFGTQKVFRAAIFLFTIGSMLCGMSHTLGQLVAFRILQGMGGAMMVPVGRLVILKTVPKSQLVQAMTYLTVPAVLGPVLGPPVGGFIVTYSTWRWIFFINLPICALGMVLITLYVPNIYEEDVPPIDFPGFLMTGLGLAGVVFGLEAVGRGVIPIWMIAASAISGACFLALYVRHSRTISRPIVDLKLLRIPTFAASTMGGGLFRMCVGAMPFLLPMQLQVGFGLTAFASGLLTFASAVGALTMKFTVQPIVRRFGFRRVLIFNGFVTAASVASCALFRPSTPHLLITAVLLTGGFFRSLQFTSLNALAYSDVSPKLMSSASSLASMTQQLFVSFGVTFAALLLHSILAFHGEAKLTAHDISPAFVVVAMFPILSSLTFLRLEHHAGHEISGHRSVIEVAETEPQVSAVAD